MDKVITIHEAKTHLSRYIQKAKAGEPVYIGAYGQEEVMLTLVPKKQVREKRKLGIWANEPLAYKDEDIMGSDLDIIADFEESINRPFPE